MCQHNKQTNTHANTQKQEKPNLSAQDIQRLNMLLWEIDTDEGIRWWKEDISDEELQQVKDILFQNE